MINRFKKLNIACLEDEIKQKWEVYCKHYLETLHKIRRDYDDCRINGLFQIFFSIFFKFWPLPVNFRLLKFSDTWHVPQDWPRRPGIVRHMEFCAKRIIQPMNTIKKNAPHLIEPDYMKTHKMMNQIRREYDQACFIKFDLKHRY